MTASHHQTSSKLARHALPFAATLAVLNALTFAAGIEGCGGTTGLRRVRFSARAGAVERGAGPITFETRTGFRVTLSEARVAVGPIYFNTLAPLETSRRLETTQPSRARRSLATSLRSLLVPLAHAHGESHFGRGRIVAEVNEQREIDLNSGDIVTFERGALGVDEPVRTAELWLYNRESMSGAVLRVAGVAERDGRSMRFAGGFAIDPAAATQEQPLDAQRQVRGIPVEFVPDEEVLVDLRIDLRPCFIQADFSELASLEPDRDGVRHFSRRDNVGAGVEAGLRSTRGTWTFRVLPKPASR
jgi:hypothetical protein